jgi:hypothetical protein
MSKIKKMVADNNKRLGRGPVKEITWTGVNGTGVQCVTISHYRHDGKLIKKELPNKEVFLYTFDNLGKLEKMPSPREMLFFLIRINHLENFPPSVFPCQHRCYFS